MSAEPKEVERNELAARLGGLWEKFKRGQLLSYRTMALLLILITAIGLWLYISAERRKAVSRSWMEFDEATSADKLEDLARRYPDTNLALYARLSAARGLLGVDGVDQLNSGRVEKQTAALDNIDKARKVYAELVSRFENDPAARAECYLGLAKAEMALVAVPEKPDDLTRFRGEVAKVVEYLDEFLRIVPADSPVAKDAQRYAEILRQADSNDPQQRLAAEEFKRVQRSLYEMRGPLSISPGGPLAPSNPPTVPVIPGRSGK